MARGNTNNHKRAGHSMSEFVTLDLLHQHFILDGDKLIWNPARPKSHFKNDRVYNSYMNNKAGREAGSSDVSIGGYKQSYVYCLDSKKRLQYNHRIVWCMANNRLIPAGFVVDHRDGNPENNCPSNLRLVSNAINSRNRKPLPGQVFGARKYVNRKGEIYYYAHHQRKRIDTVKYPTAEAAGRARDLHIIGLGLDNQFRLNFDLTADNENNAPKGYCKCSN